jgi:hypothetical protein
LNDVDILKVISQSHIAQIKSVPFSTDERPTGEASYGLAYDLAYDLAYVVKSVRNSELENWETYFGLMEALDEALLLRQQTTYADFQDVTWSMKCSTRFNRIGRDLIPRWIASNAFATEKRVICTWHD